MSTDETMMVTNRQMVDFLTEVYTDYLAKHNLPEVPAEELPFVLFDNKSFASLGNVADMSDHQEWIDAFTEAWDHYV